MKRAAILAFIGAALCGALLAAPQAKPDAFSKEGAPPLGYTYCDDELQQAVSYVRLDVLDSEHEEAVAVHEYLHGRVIQTFGSCGDYDKWLDTPANRLEAEAAGMCASARSQVVLGRMEKPAAVKKYAGWLFSGYPQFELTVEQAEAAVWKYCASDETDLILAVRENTR